MAQVPQAQPARHLWLLKACWVRAACSVLCLWFVAVVCPRVVRAQSRFAAELHGFTENVQCGRAVSRSCRDARNHAWRKGSSACRGPWHPGQLSVPPHDGTRGPLSLHSASVGRSRPGFQSPCLRFCCFRRRAEDLARCHVMWGRLRYQVQVARTGEPLASSQLLPETPARHPPAPPWPL